MNRRRRSFVEWGAFATTAAVVVSIEVLKVTVGYSWNKLLGWIWPNKKGKEKEESEKDDENGKD